VSELPAEGNLTPEQVSAWVNDSQNPYYPELSGKRPWNDRAEKAVAAAYARIPGGDKPVLSFDDRVAGNVPEATPDATAFRQRVDPAMAELPMDAVRAEGARLFSGAGGSALLDVLDNATIHSLSDDGLAEAHVRMGVFLADMEELRRKAPPSGEGPTGADFEASLDAELRKTGVDRQRLVEIEQQLFADRRYADYRENPAYQHALAYIGKFPPSVRAQALVRYARELMSHQQRQQSVS